MGKLPHAVVEALTNLLSTDPQTESFITALSFLSDGEYFGEDFTLHLYTILENPTIYRDSIPFALLCLEAKTRLEIRLPKDPISSVVSFFPNVIAFKIIRNIARQPKYGKILYKIFGNRSDTIFLKYLQESTDIIPILQAISVIGTHTCMKGFFKETIFFILQKFNEFSPEVQFNALKVLISFTTKCRKNVLLISQSPLVLPLIELSNTPQLACAAIKLLFTFTSAYRDDDEEDLAVICGLFSSDQVASFFNKIIESEDELAIRCLSDTLYNLCCFNHDTTLIALPFIISLKNRQFALSFKGQYRVLLAILIAITQVGSEQIEPFSNMDTLTSMLTLVQTSEFMEFKLFTDAFLSIVRYWEQAGFILLDEDASDLYDLIEEIPNEEANHIVYEAFHQYQINSSQKQSEF